MKKLIIFFAIFTINFSCSRNDEKIPKSSCGERILNSKNNFDFIFIGDQGSSNGNQQEVSNSIENFCSNHNCDAVVLLGDNFYDTGVYSLDDPKWNSAFFYIYEKINLPFYAILGNHDYNVDDFIISENQVNKTNYQSKWIMPGHIWKLKSNLFTFLALDSQKLSLNVTGSLDSHKKCFGDDLTSRDVWKIGLGHHPFLSNGPHGSAYRNNINFHENYLKLLCNNIDIYFSGHDHILELFSPNAKCSEHFVISGAGGSDLYDISNIDIDEFSSKNFGFVHLKISLTELTINFYNSASNLMYSKTINH